MKSDLNAALALVDFGDCRDAERPQDWINVAGPMCAHCIGAEDVNLAAARIIAAEYRKALSVLSAIAELRESKGATTQGEAVDPASALLAATWHLGFHDRGLGRGDYAVFTESGDLVVECRNAMLGTHIAEAHNQTLQADNADVDASPPRTTQTPCAQGLMLEMRKKLDAVANIVTTHHETKESFISRVRSVLWANE
jgi:hypothetical protein